MGQAYVSFTRNSTEQIRSKVIDELWILNFFEVSWINESSEIKTKKVRNNANIQISAMVPCPSATAVQLVDRATGSQFARVSMHLPRSHRQEDILRLRASGSYGRQTKLENISDGSPENADGRSNLCLNHELSARRVGFFHNIISPRANWNITYDSRSLVWIFFFFFQRAVGERQRRWRGEAQDQSHGRREPWERRWHKHQQRHVERSQSCYRHFRKGHRRPFY